VKLDEAAFKRLTAKRRFKGQTLEIAKRRMLNGESAPGLAAAYGINRKRVYTIEAQIKAAWEELQLPEGWSEVTLVAPQSLIEEFQRRASAAREKLEITPTSRGARKKPSKPK
jgi:hypothetical protein